MRRSRTIGAAAAGGIAVGAITAITAATVFWNRATARAVRRLRARARALQRAADRDYSPDDLTGLPAPVARFFEFALTPGQPRVRLARVRQTGEFLMRPGGRWRPFTAVQHIAARPPAFVWDATIHAAPLLDVRVRDSYLGGTGAMTARLASLVPLVNQRGTPEMNAATLVRWLAEAVWLPTALLPHEGVTWAAVDDDIARATIIDGTTAATLDVEFGARGEIVRASAERYRDVRGVPVRTPWVCHYRDYARTAGMMVPMTSEVEWVLPRERLPYWRAGIASAEYELAT